MSYIVTAPLVIVKNDNGQLVHLYEGATVPDSVSEADMDRLANLDMVEKDGTARASKAKSKGEPTDEQSE